MHAANHAARFRKSEIALRPADVEAVGGEFVFAEGASEEAALVFAQFKVNHPQTGERCFGKFHASAGCSNDGDFGNRNDELATFFAVGFLLGHDFIGEVPCQQERVIGVLFE